MKIQASHISLENLPTNRRKANRALKAMTAICGYDNGTITRPVELASSYVDLYKKVDSCGVTYGETFGYTSLGSGYHPSNSVRVGRMELAKAINEGIEFTFNDGWYIVEFEDDHLYVDFTGFATRNMKATGDLEEYLIEDDFKSEEDEKEAIAEGLKVGKNLYRIIID